MIKKLTTLAVAVAAMTSLTTAFAQQPVNGMAPAPQNMPMAPQGMPMPYGRAPMPYGRAPMPYANSPYANGPYGNPMMPNPYMGNPYAYGPRGFNNGFFPGNRNGFGRGMPFESNFTPWSRRFWDEIGDGGDNPFRNMDGWFRPGDPKEGAAQMWDDMLNAPSEMGQMPGGWTAPSISVPNPVDVGDEFSNAARDMPGEMKNQMDNIDIQTW